MAKISNIDRTTERFNSKIERITESGCWIWTGCANELGYGMMVIKNNSIWKTTFVHRFSYQLHKGEIPNGFQIDHLCMVKCCVNPNHLELVTAKENTHRAIKFGIGGAVTKANKTHCPKGHQYSGENLYIYPNGYRECRICRKENKSSFEQKRKQKEAMRDA